jgi:hypothetical protein
MYFQSLNINNKVNNAINIIVNKIEKNNFSRFSPIKKSINILFNNKKMLNKIFSNKYCKIIYFIYLFNLYLFIYNI